MVEQGNNAAAMRLCDELIQAAYDADIYSPGDLAQRVRKIKAALAKPPRNCDVYRTKEEAEKAFLSEPCDEPCGNCTISNINNECGVRWLFAKAEGGAK